MFGYASALLLEFSVFSCEFRVQVPATAVTYRQAPPREARHRREQVEKGAQGVPVTCGASGERRGRCACARPISVWLCSRVGPCPYAKFHGSGPLLGPPTATRQLGPPWATWSCGSSATQSLASAPPRKRPSIRGAGELPPQTLHNHNNNDNNNGCPRRFAHRCASN